MIKSAKMRLLRSNTYRSQYISFARYEFDSSKRLRERLQSGIKFDNFRWSTP